MTPMSYMIMDFAFMLNWFHTRTIVPQANKNKATVTHAVLTIGQIDVAPDVTFFSCK
jgi:hypothetical protein